MSVTRVAALALLIALLLPERSEGGTYIVFGRRPAASACSDLSSDSNLEGWWRLEEDDSPPAEDRLDETANNNDLTDNGVEDESTVVKQGSFSQADLNTNGDLRRVDTNLSSGFPGKNGETTTAFSFGGWFRSTAGTAGCAMCKASSAEPVYRIAVTTGPKWRCGMVNSSSTQFLADANSNLNYDQWYHVWCDWDGSTLTLYVDGVAQTDTESVSSLLDRALPFTMFDNNIGNQFDGYIDDAAIFSRSLSADEIACIESDALDAGGYP